jgi:hypothetical protein
VQAPPSNRLADPRSPLSVDEGRDFRAVRAAAYFLRLRQKKVSYRAIARIFQAVQDGLRTEAILAYLKRLDAIESLKNQGGKHPGSTSEAFLENLGSDFEHDGKQNGKTSGSTAGSKNRVSSLTENVNINDGKTDAKPRLKEPTDGECRVLEVCYQWERGISIPMPADLKPLLDTMRLTMDLPRRPGV